MTTPAAADVVRTLLVVPTAAGVGMARTCLGVSRALDRRGVRVGFFKPVAELRDDGGPDPSLALWATTSALRPPDPLSSAELESQLGEGGIEGVLEWIVGSCQLVRDQSDVVVVEGLSPGATSLYASGFSQSVARALDADVLLVDRWPHDEVGGSEQGVHQPARRTATRDIAESVAERLAVNGNGYWSGEQARVVGCVVHGLPTNDPSPARELAELLGQRGLRLVGAVPHHPHLAWLRVSDLVRGLRPRVLNEGNLSRRIENVAVFAQGVPGGLRVLNKGRLVVVPGDRHDVIMAACLATLNGTRLAALLLSAGMEPDPRVWALTRAAGAAGLPILVVDDDSYETATRVRNLDSGLVADDPERTEGVIVNIADALDASWLASLSGNYRSRQLSPAAFRYQLVNRARAADALIVLPEGTEPRTIQAAIACAERGVARSLLLGPPEEVAAVAESLGLTLPSGVTVVDPLFVAERYVGALTEIRRHRSWSEDVARDHLSDPIMVGTMMLKLGEVDGLVAGALHATAATVRPALQVLGMKPASRLVSSVFFMCLPDEVLVYGDCAVNPRPDADDLADIAIQSAASARAFGIAPRVAMISFSTGHSGAGDDVDRVAEATRIVREREPGLAVDGPLQYDAATVESVGHNKRPGSAVAGHATVFVFPDLDTGNTTYKAVQRSAHIVTVGPILQGLAKPVNDLSRGASVEDIIYTVAVTAIQSQVARALQRAEGNISEALRPAE